MAAVSVTFDGTLLSAAESASDGGVWDKAGASQTPTQEQDFLLQGVFAQSNKASNNVQGVEFEDDGQIDFSTTPKAVLAKVLMATPGTIDLTVAKGYWYEIGEGVNGGTWDYTFYVAGLFAGPYPALSSWLALMIDPNQVAFRDEQNGTVDLTTVDYYATIVDTDATAKSDNVVHDRLDFLDIGTGLTLVGGDGGDDDGLLTDFLAFDFDDTTLTGRMSVVQPGKAEVIVNGVLTVGTATATVFNDANRFIVFPFHPVGEGALGFNVGMANASNDINLTAYTFKGLGNASVKKFFDTALEIDGSTEVITIVDHGWQTGDLVTYSDEGGTAPTGLTDATQYFVNVITDDTFSIHIVGLSVGRQNSYTDTSRVDLTADSAPGENHSFIRDPDNRFDYDVTGTTGVGHTLVSCTLDGARLITFTSLVAMIGGFVINSGKIDLDGGTMTGVDISSPTLAEGDAIIDPLPGDDLASLSDMSFVSGPTGHAIRVTSASARTWDHSLSGYWSPADLGWNFSTAQAFTSEQLDTNAAHGFTTGDAVYYNDEGGAENIGLTNGNKYYVNVVDSNTVTVHLTKAAAIAPSSAIDLTTSGSETQSLYSANAALFNDTSSGTLTITVSGGTPPSIRNADGATTVVNSDVTITLTGLVNNTEVIVYDSGDGSEIAHIENVTGNEYAFSDAAANVIDIFIQKPDYYRADILSFTMPPDDTSIPVQQRFDPNFVND